MREDIQAEKEPKSRVSEIPQKKDKFVHLEIEDAESEEAEPESPIISQPSPESPQNDPLNQSPVDKSQPDHQITKDSLFRSFTYTEIEDISKHARMTVSETVTIL